jgi:uncharacterized protein
LITNKQIQEVTNIIVKEIQPEKVLLFGSYASGLPDSGSDIDILVVVDKDLEKKSRMEAMMTLLKTALANLLFAKDFKMYSLKEYNELKKNKLSFLYNALRNAKTLYER